MVFPLRGADGRSARSSRGSSRCGAIKGGPRGSARTPTSATEADGGGTAGPTAARTSSWRPLAHELATRWPRVKYSLQILKDASESMRRLVLERQGHNRTMELHLGSSSDWLTICSTSAASRAITWSCARRTDRTRLVVDPAVETSPATRLQPRPPTHVRSHPADLPGRRLDAAGPGVWQPINNAAQVHRGGRPHLALGRARMGHEVPYSVRDNGIGIPARHAAASLRHLHAGRSPPATVPGRTWHRPDACEATGRDARRQRRGPQRGSGQGQRVRRASADFRGATGCSTGIRRPGRLPAPRRRILVVDDNRDAADSLAMLLKLDGDQTRTASMAWASPSPRPFVPMWCCWISACPR